MAATTNNRAVWPFSENFPNWYLSRKGYRRCDPTSIRNILQSRRPYHPVDLKELMRILQIEFHAFLPGTRGGTFSYCQGVRIDSKANKVKLSYNFAETEDVSRFVVAHGLAHVVAHGRQPDIPVLKDCHHINCYLRCDHTELHVSANWFARELLIPSDEVVDIAKHHAELPGFKYSQESKHGVYGLVSTLVPKIAKMYNVPTGCAQAALDHNMDKL
jgi:hypothetical protein